MAYTKILVIHNRLDKCVGYTQDSQGDHTYCQRI